MSVYFVFLNEMDTQRSRRKRKESKRITESKNFSQDRLEVRYLNVQTCTPSIFLWQSNDCIIFFRGLFVAFCVKTVGYFR